MNLWNWEEVVQVCFSRPCPLVAVCYPLALSRWFILVTNVVSNNCKYENNIDTNKTDFTNNLYTVNTEIPIQHHPTLAETSIYHVVLHRDRRSDYHSIDGMATPSNLSRSTIPQFTMVSNISGAHHTTNPLIVQWNDLFTHLSKS